MLNNKFSVHWWVLIIVGLTVFFMCTWFNPLPANPAGGDEILVGLNPGSRLDEHPVGAEVLEYDELLQFYRIKITGEPAEVIKAYRQMPEVAWVEPNRVYRSYFIPDDPLYLNQWSLSKMNLEKSWEKVGCASGITVAVLDSGVDFRHPDLKGVCLPGYNVIDPKSSPIDDNGHGTHIAGIIGAVTNNTTGIAGIAGCRILPVKVLGTNGEGNDADIARGICWAVDNGAQVINLSFGNREYSSLLHRAIRYAKEKDVLVIAAVGNEGSSLVNYPAAFPEVLAVGATDRDDQKAQFSNYGLELSLCGPGVGIISTYWDQKEGSTYRIINGTSVAAAHVAGLAALIRQDRPELTVKELRCLLEKGAVDLGASGWDRIYGYGRVDADALFQDVPTGWGLSARPETAQELELGVQVENRLLMTGETQWYCFAASDAGELLLEAEPPAGLDLVLELYDDELNLIAVVDDYGVGGREAGQVSVPHTGIYYLQVKEYYCRWAEETYTLKVSCTAPLIDRWELNDHSADASPIKAGEEVIATIYPAGDIDWYQVEVPGGGALKIELSPPPELDGVLQVYNMDLNLVQTVDTGGRGESETAWFTATQPGYLYLRVSEFRERASSSVYQLRTTFVYDENPPKITWISPSGFWLGKDPEIRFRVEDKETGLAAEKLCCYWDEEKLPLFFNPEEEVFLGKPENFSEGPIEVRIVAMDRAGNTAVLEKTFLVDTISPDLSIQLPAWSAVSPLVLKGTTKSGAVVTVNKNPVVVKDGEFQVKLTLRPGPNEILVEARDAAGNHSVFRKTVVYAPDGMVITGKILLEHGSDHQGIKVSLVGTGLAAETNPDGTFALTSPSGSYRLRVERPGYLPFSREITLVDHLVEVNAILPAGDFEGNGVVDQEDLALLRPWLGCPVDENNRQFNVFPDRMIDVKDLAAVARNLGQQEKN